MKTMNKEHIGVGTVFFLLLLLAMPVLVVAQPPGQVSQQTGLDIATAYPSTHKLGDDFSVQVHIYDSTNGLLVNTGLSCSYHLYNHMIPDNQHISIGSLSQYGAGYNATVSGSLFNVTGSYATLIWCNSSTVGGWFEYEFQVTTDGLPKNAEPSGLFSVIALIPLLFAFLMLFGAFSMDEEHSALRIFLFLLSTMMILLSLYFATISVIRFYEFPVLQDAVGDTVYWLSWLIVFIVTYFIIYFVWKAFEGARRGKIERMNY